MRRLLVMVSCCAVAAVLTTWALQSGVFRGNPVVLSSAVASIPKCSPHPTPVAVEDLALKRWTSCDMGDLQVVFPDGQVVDIDAPGGSAGVLPNGTSDSFPRYYVENLGSYGVVAVRELARQPRTYWGAPKAVDLIRQTPDGI